MIAAGGPAAQRGSTFDSGSIVYSQGDPGSSMFLVCRGVAESGGRQLSEGHTFGEAQVLGDPRRRETVRARTTLHVLEVRSNVLARMLGPDSSGAGSFGHKGAVFVNERRYFETKAMQMFRERQRLTGVKQEERRFD